MAAGPRHAYGTGEATHRTSHERSPRKHPGSLPYAIAQEFSVYRGVDVLCRRNVCFTARQIAGLLFADASSVKRGCQPRLETKCCGEILNCAIELAHLHTDQSAGV